MYRPTTEPWTMNTGNTNPAIATTYIIYSQGGAAAGPSYYATHNPSAPVYYAPPQTAMAMTPYPALPPNAPSHPMPSYPAVPAMTPHYYAPSQRETTSYRAPAPHIQVYTATSTGAFREVYTPLERIKENLLQIGKDRHAEINGCANSYCCTSRLMRILGALTCIPAVVMVFVAIYRENNRKNLPSREMELLHKYFTENPNVQAYSAYKNFVKDNSLFVDTPLMITDGKGSSCAPDRTGHMLNSTQWLRDLLNRTTDDLQDGLFTPDPDLVDRYSIHLLPVFLLLWLPRIKQRGLYDFDINEKQGGFSYLQGLAIAPETPLTKLAIYALLDAGADPSEALAADTTIGYGRTEIIGGYNALQLAQRFGRNAHAEIIANYMQQIARSPYIPPGLTAFTPGSSARPTTQGRTGAGVGAVAPTAVDMREQQSKPQKVTGAINTRSLGPLTLDDPELPTRRHEAIAHLPKLREVITRLQANDATLKEVNLTDNNIGDAGAYALAYALRYNKTLIKINLSGNNIGDSGASALATALVHNKTLTTIDLLGNCIPNSAVLKDIERQLARNQARLKPSGGLASTFYTPAQPKADPRQLETMKQQHLHCLQAAGVSRIPTRAALTPDQKGRVDAFKQQLSSADMSA